MSQRGYADQLLRDLQCANGHVYSAVTVLTAAASATDVFTIAGAAGKTITIIHASITGIQTTSGSVISNLIKRSTVDTGGTSSTITGVPLLSTWPAASAVVKAYTANPTLGTTVGTLQSDYLFLPDITGNRASGSVGFVNIDSVPIAILTAATEQVAINMNGATISGNSLACHFIWMEI